ncbi:MAG: tetratricopeptide repeat protein [Propionibacteriaceae bacterium]|jgi:putative thioredoxin|nr:tetratricopeptide repeat protein [Propionibacteriaceae bacterium]
MPFNPAQAIDLSAIAEAAKNPPPPPGAASYVAHLDQANFNATMQLSVKHPVILVMYSGKDASERGMLDILENIANNANGAFLLAEADIDTLPELAQQFGIQAVPTVLAVIAGQLAPLFQGTRDAAEVQAVLGQVLQAAQQAGLTGRAAPVSVDDKVEDPRFDAANAAMESGNFDLAVAEFEKILEATPADPEAKIGRSQAAFLARVAKLSDPAKILLAADENPDDLDAQLAAADVEMAQRGAVNAFARLIAFISGHFGDARDTARVRLLELFDTIGPDSPEVQQARRELTAALF